MTFLSPARLLLLAVPVALLVAYLIAQRLRRRDVVRFTSVDLLASVAPRRPGWQRHLPAAGLLLALVCLTVGFARPTAATRVPRESGNVVLALDTSNSMGATDVAPSRLAAAVAAAKSFVNGLPHGLHVGVVSFDRTARLLVAPTADRATVLTSIERLELGPGTATGDALFTSLNTINATPVGADGKTPPAVVVLMSDGTPTVGQGDESPEQTVTRANQAAKQAGVPVDTIAYGTSQGTVDLQGQQYRVPADPAALEAIAAATGGKAFTATTGGELASVYDQITRTVGYTTQHREVTAWFTGLGLLICALAGSAALVWTNRLV